jgi:hypothetical protein
MMNLVAEKDRWYAPWIRSRLLANQHRFADWWRNLDPMETAARSIDKSGHRS